jgi:hypothetical protein
MVRLVCFRQRKNLSKNLREALRSFRWDTHHIADVADLKFCLLLACFFEGGVQFPRKKYEAWLARSADSRRHAFIGHRQDVRLRERRSVLLSPVQRTLTKYARAATSAALI